MSFGIVNADEAHDHGVSKDHGQAIMQNQTENQMHGHSEEDAHHRHDKWIDPPAKYADKESNLWADLDAIQRGEKIYQAQCLSCHGADGQGSGPVASSLSHQPADLTNNFHTAPGSGDAYLFWRVSEGGTVEPFKSQNSAMPPFKVILSESERWDVLPYIHTLFHQGLASWNLGNGEKSSD
ncbi:MAG: cytochrome c [Arenicellales bacterium]